ncbi:protein broad-minded-like [Protopterus annectens]|uniref:protein broad-minded-like n=1 Tax=Protopterus annectens TaxID=7888 RepID=UPI001CF94166|nr:protein broad-minded-like [Protopterus annectens]
MSHFSSEDEAELQSLLRQLLKSVKEKIAGAPSVECAEEILLHLEETDENFHNYEFVRYLRRYISSVLGNVIEEEAERCASAEGQAEGLGHDTLVQHVTKKTRDSKEYREMMHSLKSTMMMVVESLINKFEEDQMRKEEMHRKTQHGSGHYTDNCSDSDSSFNQSYTFMNQEQLQIIAERLDPSQTKEVQHEALQTLCCAPLSDVLNSESWSTLRQNLVVALQDPDATFSVWSALFITGLMMRISDHSHLHAHVCLVQLHFETLATVSAKKHFLHELKGLKKEDEMNYFKLYQAIL